MFQFPANTQEGFYFGGAGASVDGGPDVEAPAAEDPRLLTEAVFRMRLKYFLVHFINQDGVPVYQKQLELNICIWEPWTLWMESGL